MGYFRPLAAILLLSVAACGDDGGSAQDASIIIVDTPRPDTITVDSPPAVTYDLSCYQNTAPAAEATVAVSGTAQAFSGTALAGTAGVTIKACNTGDCATPLATVGPTVASGDFTMGPLTTGGTAINGYLLANKEDYWPTYLYPAAPIAKSLTGAPLLLVNDSNVNLLETFLMFSQNDANGIVAIAVTDCGATPMAVDGADVTVKANGVSVGGPPIDAGALAGMGGAFFVPNVPPGIVTVSATYDGKTFVAHDVKVVAKGLTTAQVKPGY